MKKWVMAWLGLGLAACSQVAEDGRMPPKESVATMEELKAGETAKVDKVQLFNLPSPLQVASVLMIDGFDVRSISDLANNSDYLSSDQLALNLGIKTVALGSAAIYEQSEHIPALAKDIVNLADQLDLTFHKRGKLMERLSANSTNQDSLYHLVLHIYDQGQKELIQMGNERTASYVIVGCYLSGLELALSAQGGDGQRHDKLIGHQKLYLKSLIRMMETMDSDEVFAGVITQLKDLYTTFDLVKLNLRHPSEKPFKVEKGITPEVRDTLLKHTEMILQGVSGVAS